MGKKECDETIKNILKKVCATKHHVDRDEHEIKRYALEKIESRSQNEKKYEKPMGKQEEKHLRKQMQEKVVKENRDTLEMMKLTNGQTGKTFKKNVPQNAECSSNAGSKISNRTEVLQNFNKASKVDNY